MGKGDRSAAGRWWQRLAVLGVAGATLLFLAPMIVANTPLLQWFAGWVAPEYPGKIVIGSASLNWFSPVVLRGVEARDPQGQRLLTVSAIRTEKSLLSLARDSVRLGVIRLEQPTLRLALRDDGSNLEDALAPFFERRAAQKQRQVTIEIMDGAAEIVGPAPQHAAAIEKLQASLGLPWGLDEPTTLRFKSAIFSGRDRGAVEGDLEWKAAPGPAAGSLGEGQVLLKTDAAPLAALQGPLRRLGVRAELAGLATGEAVAEWKRDGADAALDMRNVRVSELAAAVPEYLGDDVFYMSRLDAGGQIVFQERQLQLKQLSLRGDVGEITAEGVADVRQRRLTDWLSVLQNEDYQVRGEIDLARLAQVLPNTLGVRQGAEVTSGKARVHLSSLRERDERAWRGRIEIGNLAALSLGRRVNWTQPIEIDFGVRDTARGLVVDHIDCKSDFLRLALEGALDEGSLSASADLDRLTQQAGQFLDWQSVELAGKLACGVGWRRDEQNRFGAQGRAVVRNLVLTAPGVRPWREERLEATLTAAGAANAEGLNRIDSGALQVVAGGDQCVAQLLEPVERPRWDSTWPARARLTGALATWLPRLQSWAPFVEWDLNGGVDLTADARVSPSRVDVSSSTLQISQLLAKGPGWLVQEPLVKMQSSGGWDRAKGQLLAADASLACSTLSFRASNLLVELRETGARVRGELAYRADLARLMACLAKPPSPNALSLYGLASGRVKFAPDEDAAAADFSAEIDDFALAKHQMPPTAGVTPVSAVTRAAPLWQEKKLTLSGAGAYDFASDTLRVARFEAAGADSIRLTAAGVVTQPATRARVDLQGDVACDMRDVAARLRPLVGGQLQLSGANNQRFSLRGPLFPPPADIQRVSTASLETINVSPELMGDASLTWASGAYQGLNLGRGELRGDLKQGVVFVSPISLPMAQGKLTFAPRVMLNRDPQAVVLEKGPIAEQLRVTPEMCQNWLKYVAPLLADATQAQGTFSAAIEGAVLPLADPLQGDAQGVLRVHSARVGPGPLGRELLLLGHQLTAILERRAPGAFTTPEQLLSLPEQDVPFQLAEGRVHHQNLLVTVKDVVIRTRGSVGLDQSVSLVAEIPIRDQWVARDRLLAGLKGQSLQVPISGTLNQPRLDTRAVGQLSRSLIENAAGNLIENELQKGLQKLFK